MARKIAVLSFWLLPTLLLSGCNLIEGIFTYNTSGNSTNISEENQFAATNFPLESCGDSLPENPRAYPLEVYSVNLKNERGNMEENRRNVEIIKSEFCPNASVGTYHEQYEIASLIGRERANEFMNLFQNKLGKNAVNLGEPVILEAPPSPITIFHTKEEIGEAAGLTESQIEQLLSLETITFNSQGETITQKIKAIVPTYLPPGFELHEFRINRDGLWLSKYFLEYRNPQNYCFGLGDTGGRGDGPFIHNTIRSVYSNTFGYLQLGHTQTHRFGTGHFIQVDFIHETKSGESLGHTSVFGSSDDDQRNCKAISVQEAVKVVESLHLLNPPQKTNPQLTNNPFQSMSFPKESCGDSLPENPDAYPVEFYPVFIDYSESNLESVQSQFCGDAFPKYRETLNKDSIQVASFVGKERANQFRALIQPKFANVEIGEVSIIEAP